MIALSFEPANSSCTERDFLRELAFLDKSVEMLASVINSLPVAEIADERAGKTAQAGFWDVAARKFHHGEPPADHAISASTFEIVPPYERQS